MNAADCGLVAGVADWLFGVVLLDAWSKTADQRSSSIRPIIWRSVAELLAGILWQMACHGELLGNKFVMLANRWLPCLLMQFGDICHFKTVSGNSQR